MANYIEGLLKDQSEVEKQFQDFYQIHTYSNCQCPDGSWTDSQETITAPNKSLIFCWKIVESETICNVFRDF